MNETYIIEHDTRGILVDQDYDPYGKGANVHLEWQSKFSPTRSRTEGMRFMDEAGVRMAWSRLSPSIRRMARVRRWGSWSQVSFRWAS